MILISGSAKSSLTGLQVNRFLHIVENPQDLVNQNRMQRKLGQKTGTCFQRCVGMDALNSLYSTTFDIDKKYDKEYHKRLVDFIKMIQYENVVIGGTMTDVKGDRSLSPSQQDDPDMFVHIVKRDNKRCLYKRSKSSSNWVSILIG